MDTYLSPEMKSTGEAIGYDNKLNRALYKALQASGMNINIILLVHNKLDIEQAVDTDTKSQLFGVFKNGNRKSRKPRCVRAYYGKTGYPSAQRPRCYEY